MMKSGIPSWSFVSPVRKCSKPSAGLHRNDSLFDHCAIFLQPSDKIRPRAVESESNNQQTLVIPTQSSERPVREGVFPTGLSGRWQRTVVASLLLVYILMAVSASTQKSTTFDEGLHLTTGYFYWTQPAH